MTRSTRRRTQVEIDPSAFIIIGAPRVSVGSIRVDGRLLTVKTCPSCRVKTVISGPCVLCGCDNVVAPAAPEPSKPAVDPLIAAILGGVDVIDTSARDPD
jgi:hypothetical protein